jgi:ACS family tartrate transporter-like MFS transporter
MGPVGELDTNGGSIEARTIQKMWIRILPFVLLLYVVSFLDRINIGFAALTMNQELGISSQQFGFLVGIFFVGYSLLQIPSNLILHKSYIRWGPASGLRASCLSGELWPL